MSCPLDCTSFHANEFMAVYSKVVHEETGKRSTYAIHARETMETTQAVVTAIAVHPRDPNHLLLAYDSSPRILLWDLAKRKVHREFTLAKPHAAPRGDEDLINSVQSLSWHSSGKRFAAGFKFGGLGLFRVDKPNGQYHFLDLPINAREGEEKGGNIRTSISQIQWLCAPPNSRQSHLPGAIVFTGGQADMESNNVITLVYPPKGLSPDDAISQLMKSEQLAWHVAHIESVNEAEIAGFCIAQDQVDYCTKTAPFSMIVLSGNPMDGVLPAVSVQCLPCFVQLREADREEWEWDIAHLPEACRFPPLLQSSPLKTFTLINLAQPDSALQDDLFSTWEQEKQDPVFRVQLHPDFDWPINGGSTMEPLLKGFLHSSGAITDELQSIFNNGTMLITGHANGRVVFWDVIPPAERTSKGTIQPLHSLEIPLQIEPIPANKEISCVAFCHSARILAVGFVTGEVAVLEFGQWKQRRPSSLMESHFASEDDDENPDDGKKPSQKEIVGFRTLFCTHLHSNAISRLCLSSAAGCIAVSDEGGVVSLIQIATQSSKLLICDLASTVEEGPVSVESLLISEFVQVTDVPLPSAGPGKQGVERRLSRSSTTESTVQYREVIPVLLVGRGNGKLEMFHVQSATKIAEMSIDPKSSTSLSSIIMVDADGKRIEIPGRMWVEQGDAMGIVEEDILLESKDADVHSTPGTGNEDASTTSVRHVRSPSTELEYTRQILLEVISNTSDSSATDTVLVQSEDTNEPSESSGGTSWSTTSKVEVLVPSGSLGLHLFNEIEDHAVVKGYVADNSTAALLESKGVRSGYVITSINGVDVTTFGRSTVCLVLERLQDREKLLVFCEGSIPTSALEYNSPTNGIGKFNDLMSDGGNHTDVERPRFLVCTCGKKIHVIQAGLPRASDLASGQKEMPAQPVASVELNAAVVLTSVIRVPVEERVENCLIVLDQSNQLYVLSLVSLKLVWQTDCTALGQALDGVHYDVSYGGELIVASAFGELQRYSFFSDLMAIENALLERKCIKTKLQSLERVYPFEKEHAPSPKKNSIADAGKMFKKLVTGMKDADLNKIFQFSTEEDERKQLMGNRSPPKPFAQGDAAAQLASGNALSGTKDALMQAAQVCISVSISICV